MKGYNQIWKRTRIVSIMLILSVISPTTISVTNGQAVMQDMEPRANKVYCRESEVGISKCVGTPLPVSQHFDWCPYEPCGPIYVRAIPCDPVHPATAKCTISTHKVGDNDGSWRCKQRAKYSKFIMPSGCTGAGCSTYDTCSCYRLPNAPHISRRLDFYSDDIMQCP